jgi:hypothetical protein
VLPTYYYYLDVAWANAVIRRSAVLAAAILEAHFLRGISIGVQYGLALLVSPDVFTACSDVELVRGQGSPTGGVFIVARTVVTSSPRRSFVKFPNAIVVSLFSFRLVSFS